MRSALAFLLVGVLTAPTAVAANEEVWALLKGRRAEVYPEDVQDLARYILSHRVWLGPHAASHGVTTEMVIDDIVAHVPVP